LLIAVLVLAWVMVNRRVRPAAVAWRGGLVAAGVACVAVATVAVGQVLQPERHPPAQPAKAERYHLPGGSLAVDLSEVPRLGPASAPHTVIVLADYTCPHCRDLHAALPAVAEHYKGQVTFALMPVAMNSKCNPLVAVTDPRHTYACDLAKLALAVWRAKPEAYGEIDAYLFAPEEPRTPVDARRKAIELVGEPALARAEADSWVADRLAKDIEVYRVAGAGSIPKLVFPQDAVSYPPKDAKELIRQIDYQLDLKPTP
jgi:protein-disulfide isomerase